MSDNLILLKSRRSKYIRSLVSSLIFSALSIKLIFVAGSLLWLFPAVLFVLAGIASFIPLLPNQSYLKLEIAGIKIRSMFRTIEISWDEVEGFFTERKNQRDVVAFRYINKRTNYMNLKNLYSQTECLPDDYGMKASELADLLEYYRIRGVSAGYSSNN
jgi:hypothetical protein